MTTLEALRLRRRSKDASDRVDAMDRAYMSSADRRRAAKEIKRIRVEMVERLSKAIKGGGSAASKTDAASVHMHTAFTSAYAAGVGVAGFPGRPLEEWQMADVVLLVDDQSKYFLRFMNELASEAKMDPERRVALYGGGVDSAFWRGWLSMLPSNAQIYWRRTVAESCNDCIDYALHNPYSLPGSGGINALKQVPRDGTSRCNANCKCYLEARLDDWFSSIRTPVGVEVTQIGGIDVDPGSPGALAAADIYRELVEEYVWLTRLAQFDPKYYEHLANTAKLELRARAALLGHTVNLTVNMAEIIEATSIAIGAGYKWIDPKKFTKPQGDSFWDDLTIGVATGIIISTNDADRGIITAIETSPPSVTIDGRPYLLDVVGKNILLVE